LTRWSGARCPSLDGTGRVGTGVRGPVGSGESELASEALRGRTSRNLRPRPWGVGRVGTCVRGPEGSAESELASEALMIVISMFLRVFVILIWVSLVMVPNNGVYDRLNHVQWLVKSLALYYLALPWSVYRSASPVSMCSGIVHGEDGLIPSHLPSPFSSPSDPNLFPKP